MILHIGWTGARVYDPTVVKGQAEGVASNHRDQASPAITSDPPVETREALLNLTLISGIIFCI